MCYNKPWDWSFKPWRPHFCQLCGMHYFIQWCTSTVVTNLCFQSIFGGDDNLNILMCATSILDLMCYGFSCAHIIGLAPPIAWTLGNKRIFIVLIHTTHNWSCQRSTMTFWSIKNACIAMHTVSYEWHAILNTMWQLKKHIQE
jgi:hypothetical protein